MTLKAFTLIETLIAIAVVTLAIMGPLHVVQGVLSTSYTARDQLVAAALAQEGVEYVRQVRDTNFIYNTHQSGTRNWLYGLDGSTYLGTPSPNCYSSACTIDPGQQIINTCGDFTCSAFPLYLNSANLYTQVTAGNTQTKFTRKILLSAVNAHETLVTVTVSWTGHGSYTVVLNEALQSWL